MPIHIASRRKKAETIKREFGENCIIIDVTSKGEMPWLQFSPFYPIGEIPVPLSPGITAQSVEGIWQGLKVFESEDIDTKRFDITTMKGLKRTVRKYGRCLGHRNGVGGEKLLEYVEARKAIYLPAYHWVLENKLMKLVDELRSLAASQTVVLLDYETNADVEDTRKPLSHASLVADRVVRQ